MFATNCIRKCLPICENQDLAIRVGQVSVRGNARAGALRSIARSSPSAHSWTPWPRCRPGRGRPACHGIRPDQPGTQIAGQACIAIPGCRRGLQCTKEVLCMTTSARRLPGQFPPGAARHWRSPWQWPRAWCFPWPPLSPLHAVAHRLRRGAARHPGAGKRPCGAAWDGSRNCRAAAAAIRRAWRQAVPPWERKFDTCPNHAVSTVHSFSAMERLT